MADRELGYTGLLAVGHTPQEAWQIIRDGIIARPEVWAVFEAMKDPEGRAALDWARQRWAEHGLPAPFDDLPEPPKGGQ